MFRGKFLISGIGPGAGGVGALMAQIKPIAERKGYRVIANWNGDSLKKLLKEGQFLQLLHVALRRLFSIIVFWLFNRFVKDSKVILLHPQTIGFRNVFRLIDNNQVYIYLMDNSFFCIRSYNFHPSKKVECLNCLGNVEKVDVECMPYPASIEKNENIDCLKILKDIHRKLVFLCQNENQTKLLVKHFGDGVKYYIVGMNTGEIDSKRCLEKLGETRNKKDSFILFHGAITEAKGIEFFIDLAAEMPGRRFVVPSKRELFTLKPVPTNVDFYDVTWLTGLKELTESALVVINPSMWSAPIEGALIKSLAHNLNVATVETFYGFENEIPDEVGILRLPTDAKKAKVILESYIKDVENDSFINRVVVRKKWLSEVTTTDDFESILSRI